MTGDFFAITKKGRREWTVCVLASVSILAFEGAARAADLVAAQNPPSARSDWTGWFGFDPFKTTNGLLDGFQHQTNKDQYTLVQSNAGCIDAGADDRPSRQYRQPVYC